MSKQRNATKMMHVPERYIEQKGRALYKFTRTVTVIEGDQDCSTAPCPAWQIYKHTVFLDKTNVFRSQSWTMLSANLFQNPFVRFINITDMNWEKVDLFLLWPWPLDLGSCAVMCKTYPPYQIDSAIQFKMSG